MSSEKNVFEKVVQLSHLEELERQRREVSGHRDHDADNAAINAELPTTGLLTIGTNEDSLEPIQQVVPFNEDVDSIVSTQCPDDDTGWVESYEAIDFLNSQFKVLGLGVRPNDVLEYVNKMFINKLSDAKMLLLLDPVARRKYLIKILFEFKHDRLLEQVAQNQRDIRVDSDGLHLPEEPLLSEVIVNHLRDIETISQATGSNYLERLAQVNQLSLADMNNYKEFVRNISREESKFVPVVLLLTGSSVIGNLVRCARIDYSLVDNFTHAFNERILSILSSLNISALARQPASIAEIDEMGNFRRRCQTEAQTLGSCASIFGSHFPSANLIEAERTESINNAENIYLDSTRLKECLEESHVIIPLINRLLAEQPSLKRSAQQCEVIAEKLALELAKNIPFDSIDVDKKIIRAKLFSVIYDFYGKALAERRLLDMLTGDNRAQHLLEELYHFHFNAFAAHGNNYQLFFLVVATYTLKIIRQQDWFFRTMENVENNLVYKSKKYIGSLRKEIDALRHQLKTEEGLVYKQYRDSPLPALLNYRRSDSKQELLAIIKDLESQKHRLESRLKGLQDLTSKSEARPRL